MSERAEINKAIAVLEAQRTLLGDEVVDAAMAPLRQRLTAEERSQGKIGTEFSEERKLITILFADVVGSTALAEKLGDETTRLILDRCVRKFTKAVDEFGGTISILMGDGLMAFFGVPQAHEDDPERAVLAALHIHKYVAGYAQELGQPLEVRVGINTGRVVLGEIGSEVHSEYTAMGPPVNLAARLQSAARPSNTLLGESTARMVRYRFQVEPVEALRLKGFEEPVNAFELAGELAQPKPARGIPGLQSPLVGRDVELSKLVEMMAGLKQGIGGIAALIGEPGIGKSRLLQEIKEAQHNGQLRFAEGRAYSYTQDQPFSLILDMLMELLELAADDSPAIADLKLEAALSPLFNGELETVWPFLSTLLGAPVPPQYAAALAGLDPEALNARMIRAVQQLVEKMAERRPLVLAFEDLHWADGGSLKLIETLMLATEYFPVFLVLLFRPDLDKPVWRLKLTADLHFSHRYLELKLQPLDKHATTQMINNLLEVANFPEELRDMIGDRAQGNPLYVEELIRSLIEGDFLVRNEDSWELRGQVTDLEVPETLEKVIQARLDLLRPDERATLQTASVIGRRFAYRVLEGMVSDEGSLRNHLLRLQQVGMVREHSRLPEWEYIFKHVIVQQVTYGTLPGEQRCYLHLQAAETLENLYPERSEELAGSLAQHYAIAGENHKAMALYIVAAGRAKEVYAYEEALNFLTSAQDLNESEDTLPEERMMLLEQLADVHGLLGEALEAFHLYLSALELHQSLIDSDKWTTVRLYRKICESWRNQPPADWSPSAGQARANLEAGLTLVEGEAPHQETVQLLIIASHCVETRLKHFADLNSADFYAREAVEMAERLDAPVVLSAALNILGASYSRLGLYRKSLLVQQKRQKLSRDPSFDDLREKLNILIMNSRALMRFGQFAQAIPLLLEAEVLGDQMQEISYQSDALSYQVECWARLDKWEEVLLTEEKIRFLQRSYPLKRLGAFCWLLAFSAYVHALRGDAERATRLADESYEIMISVGGGNEDNWHRGHYY